jgi:hypothetical protein
VTRVLGSGISRQSGVERVASVIEMIALDYIHSHAPKKEKTQ